MSQLLQAGLNVTAIGMTVVFVLLTMLVFIIRGMSALSHALQGDQPPVAASATPGSNTAPAEMSNQQEIVSVISAAVAAHRHAQSERASSQRSQ